MGRKLNIHEKPKRGPGKKARKQGVPEFKGFVQSKEEEEKELSHRQRVRAKKRSLKAEKAYGRQAKKLKLKEDETQVKTETQGHILQTKLHLQPRPKLKPKKQNFVPTNAFGSEEDEEDTSEDDEEEATSEEDEEEATSEEDDGHDEKSEAMTDDEESEVMSDEEEDGFTKLEKQSRILESEKKRIELESHEEMKESAQKVDIEIPTLEEVKKEISENPDMQAISLRMKDIIFVLAKFNERREQNRRRNDYLSILEHDMCAYYSYNEFLIRKLMDLFPLSELMDFLEANEAPRPVTIRTNTLKTTRKILAQSLISQGVNLDVISWSKVGLVVYSTASVALGATSQYLSGHYILQGASSFLPVVALAAKENEKVLDMCAAPGGKSTHIAAMMRNSGILFSNDAKSERTKALIGNFHRMGISNSVITCMDGRKFSHVMQRQFDRALLDAPCSATGIISKDERVKLGKNEKSLKVCSHLQKELILAAIDAVDAKSRTGGIICYSTCSILCEENEEVINYALNKRNVKLIPTGLELGKDGFTKMKGNRFHPSLKLCKRIYPHVNNMDGFFVAKLKKLSNDIPISKKSIDT